MNIQRFTFTEFGSGPVIMGGGRAKTFLPTGRREGVPPPPPRSYSEEELKAAEREAYKKGFLEGTAEGKKQAESEQTMTNQAIEQQLGAFMQSVAVIFEDYRKTALKMNEETPKLALTMAKKIAGKALEQNAASVIEEMAVSACETLTAEPKIAITVHESLGDTLERRLQEIAAKLPAATQIVIQRDGNMPKSDCHIEWQHGSMERNTDRLSQQVEKAAESITASRQRDTAQQMEALNEQLNKKE